MDLLGARPPNIRHLARRLDLLDLLDRRLPSMEG